MDPEMRRQYQGAAGGRGMSDPDAHLLIVDDDERIRGLLQKFLARNGFLVSCGARCGPCAAYPVGARFRPDRARRDDAGRGWRGADPLRSARRRDTPILLLTAKSETEDRIAGLEAGADDYLAKPFEPKELLLRINAILRRMPETSRTSASAPKLLTLGPIRYDIERGEMWRGEDLVRLTATESQLMRIFSAKPRRGASAGRSWSRIWAATAARARSAPSTCRSPACAARSRTTRSSPATCRRCAGRDTCWRPTEGAATVTAPPCGAPRIRAYLAPMTALITHADCLTHVTPDGHPERAARLDHLLHALQPLDLDRISAPLCSRTTCCASTRSTTSTGSADKTPTRRQCSARRGHVAVLGLVVRRAARPWAALQAVDMVIDGEARNAFCATRPPGHHAETRTSMGFCLFGNAALAVEACAGSPGAGPRRGGGFRRPSRQRHAGSALGRAARTVSSPASRCRSGPAPASPEEQGAHRQRAERAAARRASTGATCGESMRPASFRVCATSRPSLSILSAGFDAHPDDPLASSTGDTGDFRWLTRRTLQAGAELCAGRVVSTLEGGYDLEALSVAAGRAHVEELHGGSAMSETAKPVEEMSFEEAMAELEQRGRSAGARGRAARRIRSSSTSAARRSRNVARPS